MPETKLPASTKPPEPAKEDIRSLLRSILETLRCFVNSRLNRSAAIATILALPIAFMTLTIALLPNTAPVPKSRPVHSLQITQPVDGARVGPIIDVVGTAPLDGKKLHYYVIVTPPQGSAQIQADPMSLSPEGELYGRAVLGNRSVGAAQTFFIQILATSSVPKSLWQTPPDTERSKAIAVIRQE